jgi:hypothetical protein
MTHGSTKIFPSANMQTGRKQNEIFKVMDSEWGYPAPKDQKSYVLPHMWTLDQGQTQQGDWTLSTW